MPEVRLGDASASGGTRGNGKLHQQTLIASAAFGADHTLDVSNERGWDWLMLLVTPSASSGTESVVIRCFPWVDDEGAFMNASDLNDLFTTQLSFSDSDDAADTVRHVPMGPGASGALWDAGRDFSSAHLLGPLPNRFQLEFDHTATGTLNYGVSALMGMGSMS